MCPIGLLLVERFVQVVIICLFIEADPTGRKGRNVPWVRIC